MRGTERENERSEDHCTHIDESPRSISRCVDIAHKLFELFASHGGRKKGWEGFFRTRSLLRLF